MITALKSRPLVGKILPLIRILSLALFIIFTPLQATNCQILRLPVDQIKQQANSNTNGKIITITYSEKNHTYIVRLLRYDAKIQRIIINATTAKIMLSTIELDKNKY